jgi:predicted lipoprotein
MLKPVKLLLFFSVILFVSCSKDDAENEITEPNSFDREALLVNWADNIIVPSYKNFTAVSEDLKEKTQQFTDNPTTANLKALREVYIEGYVQFQTVSVFAIGQAETINYRVRLNTYPADVTSIRQKASSGDFNFELPSSYDEQGFPALDYLINGIAGTDEEIVQAYSSGPNANSYKSYLNSVSASINSLTKEVLNHWESGFRDDFVSNTSSSRTGSIDRFTNEYIKYYEKFLRSGKIGIPSGIFTGNPVPENVEAYYSGSLSKTLYVKSLETVQDIFNGKHFGSAGSGLSFRQYLEYQNSIKGGQSLANLIDSQFKAIRNQASKLNPNLVEQVKTSNNVMLEAFDELQKNVILLKVDMMQALSISVDYVDSDGD